MKINYEGKEYNLDLDEMMLSHAQVIKQECGLSLQGLQAELGNGDVDAIRALFWLMLVTNGEIADIRKVDFKIVQFANAVTEATAREEKAAKVKRTRQVKDLPSL